MSFAAYPAPTWSLALHLRGPGNIDLTAAASGGGHVFRADAATTKDWRPGRYWFTLRATNGDDVQEACNGQLDVLPDLTAVDGAFDGRSENERALAAIEAVLSRRATQDQERYTINNRELWRTPIADLIRLQSFYKIRVRRERAAKAGSSALGRAVHVRFS